MVQRVLLFLFFAISIQNCQQPFAPKPLEAYYISKNEIADSAMVVSAHPLASEVGVKILKNGGNAVDAAIAVQFALAVVNPRAGNIGGGGFMVIREADGTSDAVDYREKAPNKANRDMFLDEEGNVVKGLSTAGHLACGVPGAVAGLWAAHQKFGSLEWATLVAPAVALAQGGFHITKRESQRLNGYQEQFKKNNTIPSVFIKEIEEDTFAVGALLVQTDLAQTLRRIKEQGKKGFYEGKTAELIEAEMQRGGGFISKEDLKNYEAVWRKPIKATYKDYNIISMPPSSSGGVALIQMLKMIEDYPLAAYGFHSPQAIHLMAEAERRAFADRAEHLGDSDFYDVPMDTLLDEAYLASRMSNYDDSLATQSDLIAAGDFEVVMESFETTHTSVVDKEGNAVSVTTTINSSYGNKVIVGEAGFFLNNEMDDFSVKPGVPNQFGLVGAEANAIESGKRMLSSMTPTIVEKGGDLFLVVGAPGGSTIITAVFQVIVNVVDFDMNLYDAVQAGRFHHQWLPDKIWVERTAFPASTRQALADRGYAFRDRTSMAIIKAIQVLEDGKLQGVGDKRNPDDSALGY